MIERLDLAELLAKAEERYPDFESRLGYIVGVHTAALNHVINHLNEQQKQVDSLLRHSHLFEKLDLDDSGETLVAEIGTPVQLQSREKDNS